MEKRLQETRIFMDRDDILKEVSKILKDNI
jgi:hypothetical protein